jgi:hypothetical protein
MSPTEIIATKLLGWAVLNEYGDYAKDATCASVNRNGELIEDFSRPSAKPHEIHEWPDLDDWNDIRRMEDALAEKGLTWRYFNELNRSCDESPRCLRATAEQRVAAALKVIEEAGL